MSLHGPRLTEQKNEYDYGSVVAHSTYIPKTESNRVGYVYYPNPRASSHFELQKRP